jgi:hypothetical protein
MPVSTSMSVMSTAMNEPATVFPAPERYMDMLHRCIVDGISARPALQM